MDAIFPNVRQIWMLSQKSRDVGWIWMSHTLLAVALVLLWPLQSFTAESYFRPVCAYSQ